MDEQSPKALGLFFDVFNFQNDIFLLELLILELILKLFHSFRVEQVICNGLNGLSLKFVDYILQQFRICFITDQRYEKFQLFFFLQVFILLLLSLHIVSFCHTDCLIIF